MPNIKSAKKRLRQSIERCEKNKSVKTRIKSTRRKFIEAVTRQDKETSELAFRTYCSVLDKAAKKGVIKKNTAVRRKSRAADKVRALLAE